MSNYGYITCKQATTQIRTALKRRSGKAWSVTTMRGTGYGWIVVNAPPSRQVCLSHMSNLDQVELAGLLNLPLNQIGSQGVWIEGTDANYQEYIDRAEGNEPIVLSEPIDHYAS